jgi:hypothetical protein
MFKPRHTDKALEILQTLRRAPEKDLKRVFKKARIDPKRFSWLQGAAAMAALGPKETWSLPHEQNRNADDDQDDGFGYLSATLPDPIVLEPKELDPILELHAGIFKSLQGYVVARLANFEHTNEPFDFMEALTAVIRLPSNLHPQITVTGANPVARSLHGYFGIMRRYALDLPKQQMMRVVIEAGGMISLRIVKLENATTPRLVEDPGSEIVIEPRHQLIAMLPGRAAILSLTPSDPARLDVLPLPLSLELDRKELHDRIIVLHGPELVERACSMLNRGLCDAQNLFLMLTSRFSSGDRRSALLPFSGPFNPLTYRYPRLEQVLRDKRPKGWVPVFIQSSLGGGIRWLRYDPTVSEKPPQTPPDEPQPPSEPMLQRGDEDEDEDDDRPS